MRDGFAGRTVKRKRSRRPTTRNGSSVRDEYTDSRSALAGKGDDGDGPPCDVFAAATDLGGNVFATGGFDTCVSPLSDN